MSVFEDATYAISRTIKLEAENKRLLKRIEVLTSDRSDLRNAIKGKDMLTRKLDVIINGDDAADQASLGDIVAQIRQIAKDAGM